MPDWGLSDYRQVQIDIISKCQKKNFENSFGQSNLGHVDLISNWNMYHMSPARLGLMWTQSNRLNNFKCLNWKMKILNLKKVGEPIKWAQNIFFLFFGPISVILRSRLPHQFANKYEPKVWKISKNFILLNKLLSFSSIFVKMREVISIHVGQAGTQIGIY